MPTYEHKCEACEHEWDQIYGMNDPVPTVCPKCNVEGKVKRLISWSSGRAELTGRDLTEKLWADGKKLAREARTNENLRANIMGEDKYHKATSSR